MCAFTVDRGEVLASSQFRIKPKRRG